MQHTSGNLSRQGRRLIGFTLLSVLMAIQVSIFVLFALFILAALFPINHAIIAQSSPPTVPVLRDALEGLLLLTGIVSLTLAWKGSKHKQ